MFLCDNCHNVYSHWGPKSYGWCEGCKRTAPCIDCYRAECYPKQGANVA